MEPIIHDICISGTMYKRPDYQFLSDSVRKHQPKCVVEIGTYKGLSAATIISSMPPTSHLWCVDIWTLCDEKEFWKSMQTWELESQVTLLTARSIYAATMWNGPPIDFLHIDANDGEWDTFGDIIAWMPNLNDNAFIIGHDWNFPTVQAGVRRAEQEGIFADIGRTNHAWGNFSVAFAGEMMMVAPQQWYATFHRKTVEGKTTSG